MSNVAIRVEGLGKRYRIGSAAERHDSLREAIVHAARAPLRNLQRLRRLSTFREREAEDVVWALKDIDFQVGYGEVLGIIGRNGAGKSTLLKVLSRITEPTTGRVEVNGRVGSLLEVGTGFHPELTGRENVYLNGSILGMDRAYIDRKFDEIVEFSGVERFIDTPVKRYSSGMYLRLAFAVAAHLEPEILVVDEVLAVGDAEFQKKCIGKMGEVARTGRTVLFVSHNMPAVLSLCHRSLVLSGGRIVADLPTERAVQKYLHVVQRDTGTSLASRTDREGNRSILFTGFAIRDAQGDPAPVASAGQTITLAFSYESPSGAPLRNVHVALAVHGRFDEDLFHLATSTSASDFNVLPPRGSIVCEIPRLPLQPGQYLFNLYCTVGGEIADWIRHAGVIEVEGGDFFGSGRLPPPQKGPFLVDHSWEAGEAGLHVGPGRANGAHAAAGPERGG